jgi:hypothetical protein
MVDQTTARERLREVIARQDAARGRPLTDREKLDNLGCNRCLIQ